MKDPKQTQVERNNRIDPRRIPDPVRMRLAQTIYDAILQDIQRPEFQDGYRRWMAEQAEAHA